MSFSKQLILLPVVFLLCLFSTATAELVNFEITGLTQVTVDSVFFDDVDFEILVSIDSEEEDRFPFDNGRGAFGNATTILSIPDAGIVDALATNITGITQEDFGGNQNFLLVDPNNFFNPALRLTFNGSGAFDNANSINPLNDPLPGLNSSGFGGVNWQLFIGPGVVSPRITFNTINQASVSISNASASANVPEPTSFVMVATGLLTVSLRRRRRIHRR